MPVINTHILTHHTPDNLFTLVSDIKRYPEFIRWIKAMRVSGERMDGATSHKLGEAVVGFKGFVESFATNVASTHAEKTVHVKLVRGPFRKLENKWRFVPNEAGATRVEFFIDYTFSNPILAMLAKSNSDTAVQRIMQSFLAEADRRYGPSPASPAP